MTAEISYYFTPASPWSYLGHARVVELAGKYGARLVPLPVDLGRVFPATGGLPLKQRSPARQRYRMMELKRWPAYLGVALNPEPKFFPVTDRQASLMIVAERERGGDALSLCHALMRAVWAEERNIADTDTLLGIATECGFDGAALLKSAENPATADVWERDTAQAIERGVFGAPTYVFDGELFWGQDRLFMVEEALKRSTQ